MKYKIYLQKNSAMDYREFNSLSAKEKISLIANSNINRETRISYLELAKKDPKIKPLMFGLAKNLIEDHSEASAIQPTVSAKPVPVSNSFYQRKPFVFATVATLLASWLTVGIVIKKNDSGKTLVINQIKKTLNPPLILKN